MQWHHMSHLIDHHHLKLSMSMQRDLPATDGDGPMPMQRFRRALQLLSPRRRRALGRPGSQAWACNSPCGGCPDGTHGARVAHARRLGWHERVCLSPFMLPKCL